MKIRTLLSIVVVLSVFAACSEDESPAPANNNDNQQDTTQNDTITPDPCENVQATYVQISDIIQNNCMSGCHNVGAGGINLSTYEQVKLATDQGTLIQAIKHERGVSPMPKARPKLSDAQIKQFECWKSAGFPES